VRWCENQGGWNAIVKQNKLPSAKPHEARALSRNRGPRQSGRHAYDLLQSKVQRLRTVSEAERGYPCRDAVCVRGVRRQENDAVHAQVCGYGVWLWVYVSMSVPTLSEVGAMQDLDVLPAINLLLVRARDNTCGGATVVEAWPE
jgi:hypothetical protein